MGKCVPVAMDPDAEHLFIAGHMPDEPHVPPRTEEQDLWLGVILTAIQDCFFASDYAIRHSEGKGCDVDLVRGDARRFLTMSWGPWRESREAVCQAAEVDADLLASACRKKLDAMKAAEAEQTTADVIALDTELQRLIDLESDLDPADLTEMLERLATLEYAA